MSKRQALEVLTSYIPPIYTKDDDSAIQAAIAALDDSHEGFSNRETWAAHLHIRNDAQMCQWAMDAVGGGDDPGQQLSILFDRLLGRLWNDPAGLPRYVRVALSDIGSQHRINWQEVADALQE